MINSDQNDFNIVITKELVSIYDKPINIHINLSCDNMFGIFSFGAYLYSDEWGIGWDIDEELC